jgi:4-hydroxythreonine-4-phosphate dehydrogenase
MRKTLAVTPGEPAGIGPDLLVLAAQYERKANLVAIADPDVLSARAEQLGVPLELVEGEPRRKGGMLNIVPVEAAVPTSPGVLNADNAGYVLKTLEVAVDGCLNGRFAGLVTGPVQKSIINDPRFAFSGHTEFLQARCGAAQVVMMLVAPKGRGRKDLRVALATTHAPLREVADMITAPLLKAVIHVLVHDLKQRFGIQEPCILVAGLNPHAGEGGHLGSEETSIIEPALNALEKEGINLIGPLPADTLFTPTVLNLGDAVLAMYHDQGLPVLKHVGFGAAVNVTLGLPIVRTSVDHGTALDLAGTGELDRGSFEAAVDLARRLAANG